MMSVLGVHVIALVLAGRCLSTNPKLSLTFSTKWLSLKVKGQCVQQKLYVKHARVHLEVTTLM